MKTEKQIKEDLEFYDYCKQSRISDVMLSLPDDNEINQVACDEMQKDWNDLKYQEIYRQAFVDGATWLRNKIKTGNGA